MIAFLQIVANGGAIVLCGYSLWMINKFIIRQKPLRKGELRLFWSAMAMTLCVLAIAVYLDKKRIEAETKQETYRDAVARLWFEPYLGRYPFGTLSGLEWECSNDATFNEFTQTYLVQRLWADASHPNSWIRANKTPDGLRVDCVRDGYGVDITIPPADNKPRLAQGKNFLCIQLSNLSHLEADFRVRVVDERGTQWAWARESEETKEYGRSKNALEYRTEDGDGKPLTVEGGSPVKFRFPLGRAKWEVFPHDGNAAMPSRAYYFQVIQFVVLEFGLRDLKETKKREQHRRFLKSSDQELSVLLKSIYLEK